MFENQPYFNSIKVRLEHQRETLKAKITTFQFHKGAIRTVLLVVRLLLHLDFNSIKVRLERFCCTRITLISHISIP